MRMKSNTGTRRRGAWILAAGAIAALVLTGCATQPESNDENAEEGPVTGPLTISVTTGTQAVMEEVTAAFEAKYPDIDVTLTATDLASHETTTRTRLAGGTADDILAVFAGSGGPLAMGTLVETGNLADLSDEGWSDQVSEVVNTTTSIDGKRYILPVFIGGNGIIYNTAAMEAAGLTLPETWSDLLQFCTDARAAGTPAFAYGAATLFINSALPFQTASTLVYGANPGWAQERIDGEVTFADSEWTEALDQVLEIRDAGCLQDDALGTSYEVALKMVAAGEAIGLPATTSSIAALRMEATEETDFIFHPTPATDDPSETWVPGGAMNALGINADAKNPEAARLFFEFMTTPEMQTIVAETSGALPALPAEGYVVPPELEGLSNLVEAGRLEANMEQNWPNPQIRAVFQEGAQLLLGGSITVEQLLADMDAAFDAG